MSRLAFLFTFALSAAGQGTLLVVHKQADSVGFYDLSTGVRLANVATGVKPHELVLSEDKRRAWVTDYGVDRYTEEVPGGNTLSVLDTALRVRTGVISLGKYRRPHGIERGASGRLYITSDLPGAVLVVDPGAGKILRAYELDQKLPHMVAVRRDETRLWTANSGSASVTSLRLPGGEARSIDIGGIPMGLTLSKDERRLWAVNRTGNALLEIDTATDSVRRHVELPGHPVRVRLTPDGRRLLVSLIEAGDVAILDAASLKLVHRFHAGTHAEGLSTDPGGRYGFISAQGDAQVLKFSLTDFRTVLRIETLKRPDTSVVIP